MSRLMANDFSTFELTEIEQREGKILTVAQVMSIQNQLSEAAIRKLNLKFDTKDHLAFVQEEAELQGVINTLRFLLTESQFAVNEKSQIASQFRESPEKGTPEDIFPTAS